MEKDTIEKKSTHFTPSLAASADKRDPAEQGVARIAAGCGRRATQHPAAAASHPPDRSAQPGVTTQGGAWTSLPSTSTAMSHRRGFFYFPPKFQWILLEKKSWSLPISSLGKGLNSTFSYTYRQTSHWRGKQVTKLEDLSSYWNYWDLGTYFPWRWWSEVHPTSPAVKRIPKQEQGWEA